MNARTDRERLLASIRDDFAVLRGHPQPYGAVLMLDGINFALFSRHATGVTLVLYRAGDAESLVEFPREVTVGIDQAKAESGLCILVDHVEEQGRFARTGLADDMQMSEPVTQANTERLVAIPSIGQAKTGDVIKRRSHRTIVRLDGPRLKNGRQRPSRYRLYRCQPA